MEEAGAIAAELPADEVILGGERGGLPIEGFDLGNSPADYTSENVEGKTVVFTTTNGTRAMLRAQEGDRVLIGAFVNVTAVVNRLIRQEQIHLLCAGTNDQIGRDDVLLAGMLVDRIQRQGDLIYQQNAQALTARETWLQAFALPRAIGAEPMEASELAEQLRNSDGGRNLVDIGREDDILSAAYFDRYEDVPEMDPEGPRIRLPLGDS